MVSQGACHSQPTENEPVALHESKETKVPTRQARPASPLSRPGCLGLRAPASRIPRPNPVAGNLGFPERVRPGDGPVGDRGPSISGGRDAPHGCVGMAPFAALRPVW